MTLIDELSTVARGDVPDPDSPAWSAVVTGRNPVTAHRPAVVLAAADEDDVAAGVAFAARHGLPVTVQATGHGPSAVVADGLLIHTGRLRRIEVDPSARTVRVGAGVCWGELLTACAGHGLAPLGMASVASVGVVGYTVGGGMGPFGRAQGFGADHVCSFELVGVDGETRTIDADTDPDLFWAFRGGRLGFGVITTITLELAPSPTVFSAGLVYDRVDAAPALGEYAHWQASLPPETASVATMFTFPDVAALPEALRGQRLLQIDVTHLGDPDIGRERVDRLTAAFGPKKRDDAVRDPAGWMQAQPPVPAGPSWSRGLVVDRLDADVAQRLSDVAGLQTDTPWQVVEIRPFGGALAQPPEAPNATGFRTDGVLVNTVATGDPRGFGTLPAAQVELARSLGDRLVSGAPINFLGPADQAHPFASGWSDDVGARLEAIRRERDPDGLFAAGIVGAAVASGAAGVHASV